MAAQEEATQLARRYVWWQEPREMIADLDHLLLPNHEPSDRADI